MAESRDLKSLQCGFESHHSYFVLSKPTDCDCGDSQHKNSSIDKRLPIMYIGHKGEFYGRFC